MITHFPDPYLYILLNILVMLWIWFICVQRKQLEWGRTAVQAERPIGLGFCIGECMHHMHSNSSMRCLVFPDRICLRVLYLSRPARMFSAWMTSFTVFLLSSRALANSELKAWKHKDHTVDMSHTTALLWTYDATISHLSYQSNYLLICQIDCMYEIWMKTYE